MPKERIYGTPVGVAGGPSEKPSKAANRKVAKPASDSQVHQALKDVKASDAAWVKGREAPARSASPKATGHAQEGWKPKDVVDALKNRGKRIDSLVDEAS
jgi:hypothetical protein